LLLLVLALGLYFDVDGVGNGRDHFLNREIEPGDALVGNDQLGLVDIGGFHGHDLVLGDEDGAVFRGADLVTLTSC